MLPTNPRAGAARSKSVTRQPPPQTRSTAHARGNSSWENSGGGGSWLDERGRTSRGAEQRPLRTQRSMSNVQRPRAHDQSARAPSLPRGVRERAPPSSSSNYAPRGTHSRVPSSRESNSSASSDSTASSSGSFLDRMRQRYPGSSSSQSSFEIEREPSDSKMYTKDKPNGELSFGIAVGSVLIASALSDLHQQLSANRTPNPSP